MRIHLSSTMFVSAQLAVFRYKLCELCEQTFKIVHLKCM